MGDIDGEFAGLGGGLDRPRDGIPDLPPRCVLTGLSDHDRVGKDLVLFVDDLTDFGWYKKQA
jgi:hypothetical protein